MTSPNLFLAGAPKCGTTSLADYLGQHSDIFSPLVKEPIFFGSDLTGKGERRSKEDYLALFENWRGERYALDASTHYFYSTNAAAEIAEASPDARIVMMVRNPIEAAHSMFHQLRFNGSEPLQDFDASLAAEAERAETLIPPKFGFAEGRLYTRIYNFTENIKRYERVFGAERVKVVVLDDLESDPVGVVKDLCRFLGIADAEVDRFEFDVKNVASDVRSRWLSTLSRYPPKWVGYFSKPLLSRELRIKLRKLIAAKNTVAIQKTPMDSATRKRLIAEFQPEIDRLSEYLGRDLSHWG